MEWIEYHALVGVRSFYLYVPPDDTISQHEANLTYALLAPYLSPDCSSCPSVQLLRQDPPRPGFSPQAHAYEECLREHAEEHEWLLFIDIDEFVAFPAGDSLGNVLQATGPQTEGALCVGWTTMAPTPPYTTSELQRPADTLLSELMDHSFDFKRVGKLAVRTARRSGLVEHCRFDRRHLPSAQRQEGTIFVHNCFSGAPVPVTSAAGVATDNGHCRMDERAFAEANRLITLYHFFTRTCHEWVHELVPKRVEWNQNRGNLMPQHSPRYRSDYCEGLAEPLIPAPHLQRFTKALRERVLRHPMWGQDIDFLLSSSASTLVSTLVSTTFVCIFMVLN